MRSTGSSCIAHLKSRYLSAKSPYLLFLRFVSIVGFLLVVIQVSLVQASSSVTFIRAIYYDARYPTSWAGGAVVRDGLESCGYELLNADQLKQWMNARIADKRLSVVVFAQDVAPDTVAESKSSSCTLRQYLNAGGKIVWFGDIPLYYQGHSNGTRTSWGTSGATSVLGFNASSGTWDVNQEVILTSQAGEWGLQHTWLSLRPTAATGLRVLATDINGNFAAWVKHYVGDDVFRGFVRLYDRGGAPDVDDVQRLAEYAPEIVFGDNQMDDIVAAFFYPWYGNPNTSGSWEHWGNGTHSPPRTWTSHYLPSYPNDTWNPATQLYDSKNVDVLRWQDQNLARAGMDIAIASWWGINSDSNTAFSKAVRICKSLQWCIYYELDSQGDPTPQKIHDDVKYVLDNYGPTRNYAKMDGKWLVFVYAVNGSEPAERYRQAKALLATSGYDVFFNGCASNSPSSDMPNPWDAIHNYAPIYYQTLSNAAAGNDDSASVAPGFWVMYEEPRLLQSLSAFTSAWNNVVNNKEEARFLLVETWNEWHEGTQIEPGQEIIDDYVNGFAPDDNNYGHNFIDAIAPQANALRWQSSGHRRIGGGRFEAEQMVCESGTSPEGQSEWRIPDPNARIGSAMFFEEPEDEVWLVARARAVLVGQYADWPKISFYWDNAQVGQVAVNSTQPDNYRVVMPATSGIHKLEVALANDPGGDRNVDLVVDYVDVYMAGAGGDYDEDSVSDSGDNCSTIPNSLQEDGDADGVGDACDDCPNSLPGFEVDENGCHPPIPGDTDGDGDVDQEDFGNFQVCLGVSSVVQHPECKIADFDSDGDVDGYDFDTFRGCMSGADIIADAHCADG